MFPTPPHDHDLVHLDLPDLGLHEVHVDPHPQPNHHAQHADYPPLQLTQPVYGQKDYLKSGDVIVIVQVQVDTCSQASPGVCYVVRM